MWQAFQTKGRLTFIWTDARDVIGWVTLNPQHSVASEALLGCVLGELLFFSFPLPVHKMCRQNFAKRVGSAMFPQHQRVAANLPNLLARNRAPLGDSRGAFQL